MIEQAEPRSTDFWLEDPWLEPYRQQLESRWQRCRQRELDLKVPLEDFALGHLYYGIHDEGQCWRLTEWAPNASELYLVGDMNNWTLEKKYRYQSGDNGDFTLNLSKGDLKAGQHCRLFVRFPGGEGWRLPAYSRYVVQDPDSKIFTLQIQDSQQRYQFRSQRPSNKQAPLIYEAHVGMAQEHDNIGSYRQFKEHILPYIIDLGYNTIQLMAIQEHPYYGSFGYHVSNLFAISSRFGTIDDLKDLIDSAHAAGIRVIIDLIHSHAVRNEEEGLAKLDGSQYQYFHQGDRGIHPLWDSYLYDYSKDQVLHLLLSNLRFFLDEYQVDGFRFDGITSMLYHHHGCGKSFVSCQDYFEDVDEDAVSYLYLANRLIHQVAPSAITIAEDVSGFPGLAHPRGVGFDYRLAMGVADCWFKLLDIADEQWNIDYLWHELSNARTEEQTISYVECHDQALVGGKTFFFTLADADAYYHMHRVNRNLVIDRALALHKMARLATCASAKNGYLNFMGNEFGHPEWIDFPREGNNWSYDQAKRLWSLCYQQDLCYSYLHNFDKAMIRIVSKQNALQHEVTQVYRRNDLKLLSFSRGDLIFAFNFHCNQSLTDCAIPSASGSYRVVLSSDEKRFGGFDRIDQAVVHHSEDDSENNSFIKIYLPSRCAIVLRRQEGN